MFSRTVDVLAADTRDLGIDRGLLASSELLHARRLGSKQEQRDYLASRTWLRRSLARYLSCSASDLWLSGRDRPIVTRPVTDLSISFAYTDEVALLAVAFRQAIGVDVRRLVDNARVPEPLEDLFTSNEREIISRSHDPARTHRKLLVRKGALAGAVGALTGRIEVAGLSPVEVSGLEIVDLYLANDLVAAIAVPSGSIVNLVVDHKMAVLDPMSAEQQPAGAA